MSSLCDSNELALLRLLIKQSTHRIATMRLTALRLGLYVGERGIHIHDLGAHSERWKRHFRQGVEAGLLIRARDEARRHRKVNP